MKKIIILFAALTLIIGSIGTAYADAPFKDIDDNWARDNIISVYEKGLMNGTASNKFSPSDLVNKYSVIIAIAKLMDAENEEDLDELVLIYEEELNKFKVPEYAKKETAFAREKLIILSDYELDKMNEEPSAKKLDICVYLGRAFGIEQDPEKPTPQLFFTDTEYILRPYRTYVDHMIKIDVVNGKGDKDGKFNPDELVTRAMFAKMLDGASNAYAKEHGERDDGSSEDFYDDGLFEDNDDYGEPAESNGKYEDDSAPKVHAKGIIDSIIFTRKDKPKIILESDGKDKKEFYIPENLIKENIIINGQLSDVYSLRPGMHVELNAQNKVVVNIETVEFSRDIKEEAIIKNIDVTNKEILVEMLDEDDNLKKDKIVFLKDANLIDITSTDSIYIEDLKRGQNIIIYGVEDEEGIKAITIIAM